MSDPPRVAVLFVCMGNICRSPTAEGVFRAATQREGIAGALLVDSAGIGDWHAGSPPDRRAIEAARRRGYDLTAQRARQVEAEDFARFDWILAMDRSNLHALEAMRPRSFTGSLQLFLDLDPSIGMSEVPDPYYGGPDGFEDVLDLTERASMALLLRIRADLAKR